MEKTKETATMKSTFVLFILMIISLGSCSEDPSIKVLERYSFGFVDTQEPRLLAGESVDVSVWFNIYVNTSAPVDSVRVLIEPVEGGGSVLQDRDYVSSGNKISARWTLGNESYRQVLRASARDLSGNFITYADLAGYAFIENAWNKVTGSPEVQIMDMAADTVNGVTFMTTINKLYRQGERYYMWEEVTDNVFRSPDMPRTIEIDRNGVIYVSTSGGNIMRSTDHGSSWQPCTKPWSGRSTFFQICVSNDGRLWAWSAEEIVRYSDDSGVTWNDAGADLSVHGIYDIFRLTDGTLIMHGLDCCSLMISRDDGQSWTPLPTPGYSHKLYVNEADEVFVVCSEGNSESIYRSHDQGNTFERVHSVAVSFRSSYDNIFNKWGDSYYVAMPGFGIMKSSDLRKFENFWIYPDLRMLYVDHNGVLLAKDFSFNAVYYRKNSE